MGSGSPSIMSPMSMPLPMPTVATGADGSLGSAIKSMIKQLEVRKKALLDSGAGAGKKSTGKGKGKESSPKTKTKRKGKDKAKDDDIDNDDEDGEEAGTGAHLSALDDSSVVLDKIDAMDV